MKEEKKIVKNKTSKGSIITIVLLILIIIGMCIYIAYDKGVILQSSVDVEKKDTKEEIENNEKEEKEEKELKPLKFDANNSINTTDFNYWESYYQNGLSVRLNDDNRSISISVNWEVFYNPRSDDGTSEEYSINNFSKEIAGVYIGMIGQDSIVGTIVFYLMTDGTVEYTPLYDARENNSFKSYGKIEGVTNVVKLRGVDMFPKNSPVGGMRTTIAQKADGTFYDLAQIIK